MQKYKSQRSSLSGSKGNIRIQFENALDFIVKKEWDKAVALLIPLSSLSPNNYDIWAALADSYYHLGHYADLWQAALNLVRLKPGDSDNWFNVVNAAAMNNLGFTTLYYADEFLEMFPNDERYEEVKRIQQAVEKAAKEVLASPDTERDATPDDLREMEQTDIAIISNNFSLAERLIHQTLKRSPSLIAPLNNLSLVYSIQGKFPDAINTAQQVLEKHPTNIHALSNLAQFLWRTGRSSEAETVVGQMNQAISANALLLKKIEALSYLGKDSAVTQLFEQAEKQFKKNKIANEYATTVYHLAAVAYAHQGKDKQAQQLWQTCLKIDKTFELARQNLDNLKRPVGQRIKAFPFSFYQWVPIAWIQEFANLLESSSTQKMSSEKVILNWLEQHPTIHIVLPILLERGDPMGQEFAIHIASEANLPILVDFALSENGTDDDRMNAAQKAAELGLLPRGKTVQFFVKGKLTEVFLLGYEITDEPDFGKMPKNIQRLVGRTHELLVRQDYTAAEALIRSSLAKAPNEPTLWNHLMVALQGQKKNEEVEKLVYEVVSRFPHYLFGCTAMIQLLVRKNKLEEARKLIEPLIKREKFHLSEYRAFSAANIDLLLAEDQVDGARMWLEMWEGLDEDSSMLRHYQILLRKYSPLFNQRQKR